MYGPDLFKGLVSALIVFGAIVASIFWAVVYFVVPWAWGYIKPLLHALTA